MISLYYIVPIAICNGLNENALPHKILEHEVPSWYCLERLGGVALLEQPPSLKPHTVPSVLSPLSVRIFDHTVNLKIASFK